MDPRIQVMFVKYCEDHKMVGKYQISFFLISTVREKRNFIVIGTKGKGYRQILILRVDVCKQFFN